MITVPDKSAQTPFKSEYASNFSFFFIEGEKLLIESDEVDSLVRSDIFGYFGSKFAYIDDANKQISGIWPRTYWLNLSVDSWVSENINATILIMI